jgi:hypothetical protein
MQMQNATMSNELAERSVMTRAGRPRLPEEESSRDPQATGDGNPAATRALSTGPTQLDRQTGRGTTIDTMA